MNNDNLPLGQIAVVDDTAANLHLLCNLLEDAGYDVRPFPRGKLALEGIAYSPPDLVLLDIQMPEINGYEVCEKLKAQELTQNIPIIFISALNETFDKVKAFQVGGVDYISKPFQAEEVLARVATHINLYQIKKKLRETNIIQGEKLAEQNIQLRQLNQSLEKANQELQRQYDQLQKTQLQLIKTEKMSTLGGLVAGVAHEINNPLNFIQGNLKYALGYIDDLLGHLDLYQQEYKPTPGIEENAEDIELDFLIEDLPKLIRSMVEGVERIGKISTSLRTFSRTDTDKETEFNLHEGLNSTLLILKYRLKANEQRPAIEIVKKYGDLPAVKCHAGQINQVFMNLLANAIDALDESNAGKTFEEIQKDPNRITIETKLSEDKKNILVGITDNGKGMADEVKTRIFEQGFTTKEVGKGTGLGMAIAHQIVVTTHGGTLTVDSELGQGTKFGIHLPI
ncbi:response regulator [Roseofilum sp. BLCC_M91]|uniref:histidine kinase n=1 Tax=Roseofilum halophilum BLCC-M91 TaxID=3022259 RepID=A0ABT7BG31_9CYAN|nr:response regulator [Roseofilum halophilum]MDJ1178121.1 response regulator [Roseofilum halophilum BLCC-M91]